MIVLSELAKNKIMAAVLHDPTKEVMMMGKTSEGTELGRIYVSDIFIPRQLVGPTHTDIEDDDLEAIFDSLREDGGIGLGDARCWIHSHCRMKTTPSNTDEKTLLRLAREMNYQGTPGWFAGIVVNVDEEMHGRIAMGYPISMYMDTDVRVETAVDKETVEWAEKMIGERVKEKPIQIYYNNNFPKVPAPILYGGKKKGTEIGSQVTISPGMRNVIEFGKWLQEQKNPKCSLVDLNKDERRNIEKKFLRDKSLKHLLEDPIMMAAPIFSIIRLLLDREGMKNKAHAYGHEIAKYSRTCDECRMEEYYLEYQGSGVLGIEEDEKKKGALVKCGLLTSQNEYYVVEEEDEWDEGYDELDAWYEEVVEQLEGN